MAHYSQRIIDNPDQVVIGESDAYEPRARHCFRPPVDRRRGRYIPPFRKVVEEAGSNINEEET
jgi:thymidine kinase